MSGEHTGWRHPPRASATPMGQSLWPPLGLCCTPQEGPCRPLFQPPGLEGKGGLRGAVKLRLLRAPALLPSPDAGGTSGPVLAAPRGPSWPLGLLCVAGPCQPGGWLCVSWSLCWALSWPFSVLLTSLHLDPELGDGGT